MLNNLFIRVMPNVACKVLAIVDDSNANAVCDAVGGAVIDSVNGTCIIADVTETLITDHDYEFVNNLEFSNLQTGHRFVKLLP